MTSLDVLSHIRLTHIQDLGRLCQTTSDNVAKLCTLPEDLRVAFMAQVLDKHDEEVLQLQEKMRMAFRDIGAEDKTPGPRNGRGPSGRDERVSQIGNRSRAGSFKRLADRKNSTGPTEVEKMVQPLLRAAPHPISAQPVYACDGSRIKMERSSPEPPLGVDMSLPVKRESRALVKVEVPDTRMEIDSAYESESDHDSGLQSSEDLTAWLRFNKQGLTEDDDEKRRDPSSASVVGGPPRERARLTGPNMNKGDMPNGPGAPRGHPQSPGPLHAPVPVRIARLPPPPGAPPAPHPNAPPRMIPNMPPGPPHGPPRGPNDRRGPRAPLPRASATGFSSELDLTPSPQPMRPPQPPRKHLPGALRAQAASDVLGQGQIFLPDQLRNRMPQNRPPPSNGFVGTRRGAHAPKTDTSYIHKIGKELGDHSFAPSVQSTHGTGSQRSRASSQETITPAAVAGKSGEVGLGGAGVQEGVVEVSQMTVMRTLSVKRMASSDAVGNEVAHRVRME